MPSIRTFQLSLLKRACKRAALRIAPTLIPRSLPRAKGLDCYSVQLNGGNNAWSVLVDKVHDQGVTRKWLDGDSYSSEVSVPWSLAAAAEFECSHYIELHEFEYRSPLRFLVNEVMRLPYAAVLRDRLQQKSFNRKPLFRHERVEILRWMTESTLKERRFVASSITIAATLYSNRVFFHPEREEILNYCGLLLDSLVKSGDLSKQSSAYSLTPQALQTLAMYEEEDRRHKDMLNQQKALKWLTFALILVGLIQAYAGWKSDTPKRGPNPSLESGLSTADHLGRGAPAVYHAHRGPGSPPRPAAQLER